MAMTSDYSESKMTENWKAEIWPENYFFRREVHSNIQKKIGFEFIRLKIVFPLNSYSSQLRIPNCTCS